MNNNSKKKLFKSNPSPEVTEIAYLRMLHDIMNNLDIEVKVVHSKKDIKKEAIENDREKMELNRLWKTIIDCVKEGKKLVPVGEYIPGTKEAAVFNIE